MSTLRKQLKERIAQSSLGLSLAMVGGAANLAEVLEGAAQGQALPALFVWCQECKTQANELVNAHSQRITETLAIAIIVNNNSMGEQGDSSDDAEAIRVALRTLIAGWIPDPAIEAFEYRGGKMITLENGIYYWIENYATSYYIRKI